MKNLLVAIDLETGDQKLLDQALMLGSKCDAKVWIIHIASQDPEYVGFDPGPVYIRKTLAADLREEHRSLQKYALSMVEKGVKAESLLLQGPTVDTIFDEANKLEIDMIILGSHKHNFLHRVFGDDISRQVIEKSTIPTLIVPLG